MPTSPSQPCADDGTSCGTKLSRAAASIFDSGAASELSVSNPLLSTRVRSVAHLSGLEEGCNNMLLSKCSDSDCLNKHGCSKFLLSLASLVVCSLSGLVLPFVLGVAIILVIGICLRFDELFSCVPDCATVRFFPITCGSSRTLEAAVGATSHAVLFRPAQSPSSRSTTAAPVDCLRLRGGGDGISEASNAAEVAAAEHLRSALAAEAGRHAAAALSSRLLLEADARKEAGGLAQLLSTTATVGGASAAPRSRARNHRPRGHLPTRPLTESDLPASWDAGRRGEFSEALRARERLLCGAPLDKGQRFAVIVALFCSSPDEPCSRVHDFWYDSDDDDNYGPDDTPVPGVLEGKRAKFLAALSRCSVDDFVRSAIDVTRIEELETGVADRLFGPDPALCAWEGRPREPSAIAAKFYRDTAPVGDDDAADAYAGD